MVLKLRQGEGDNLQRVKVGLPQFRDRMVALSFFIFYPKNVQIDIVMFRPIPNAGWGQF